MAIKHTIIKPVRHAGVASQDRVYRCGAAIVEGAPVVFAFNPNSGKVIEATDAAGGVVQSQTSLTGQGPILGIALNATTAADQDVLVALALPGRRFVASLTDLADGTGSDAGAHVLALADVGKYTILHKDGTTLKWVLAGSTGVITIPTMATQKFALVTAGAVGTGISRVYPQVFIDSLIDRIGATTNDSVNPPFGGTGGSGQNAFPPPNTTFQGDPATSNSGTAKVEFEFVVEATYIG
jgi:hypothetical protein